MSMPKYAMTYVVYWPEQGVLKVGRAWRFHRVQMMTRSGGHIIVLARNTDATWEREALRVLRRWFPAAFRNERDAEGVLFMGRGWSECFQVDEHHLQLAIDLCFKGFARGNDQGVNEERSTEDQRERPRVPRLPESPGRGEADSARAVVAHGRDGAPGADTGADSSGDIPGRGSNGSCDRASADAGRVGVPHDLSGRRDGMDRADATAETRHEAGVVELPGAATRTFANVRGCGGSVGAGARAGAGGGCRAGGGVVRVGAGAGARPDAGQTAPAGCPAHRMPRPPQWPIRRLWPMRDCSPPSRQMGGSAAVRRRSSGLRTVTGGRR